MKNKERLFGRVITSDGEAHIALYLMSAAAMLIFVVVDPRLITMCLGSLFCIFCNPDLDQDGLSSAETIFMRIPTVIGKGIGITFCGLWMGLWGFYAAAIKHRSPLSHWPILGSSIRLVYLYVWILAASNLVYFVACHAFHVPFVWVQIPITLSVPLVGFILGVFAGDTTHYLRDIGIFVFKG